MSQVDRLRISYFAQQERELKRLIDPKTGLLSKKFSRIISCPSCKTKKYEKIFVKRGYTFVRCKKCGLVYTNPQVKNELVENFYSGKKSKAEKTTDMWHSIMLKERKSKWRSDYYNDLIKKIKNYKKKGNLLDIGCGIGQFLEVAKKNNFNTHGLELSKVGYDYCIKNNINVFQENIFSKNLKKNSFDIITALGVFEHLTNPLESMIRCRELLKNKGLISLIVPNMYSLYNMILRDKSVTFDGKEHMIFFSMESLNYFLKQLNFKILLHDTVLTGIPNIGRYLQFYDPYIDINSMEYIPNEIRNFFKKKTHNLEKMILKNNLGLRLRVIAQKN